MKEPKSTKSIKTQPDPELNISTLFQWKVLGRNGIWIVPSKEKIIIKETLYLWHGSGRSEGLWFNLPSRHSPNQLWWDCKIRSVLNCAWGGGINVGPGPTWPRYLLKVGWVEGIYFRRLVASCCNWAILLKLCLPTECYPFTFIKGTTSKCEKITKITKFWHLCYVHVCMN